MYISTFYSFKGGVGRTMALVNAAVELAQRGRKVLAVDFDLEAPGLDTFDILRTTPDRPGIVDFVREYVATGQAPEVERFVSRTTTLENLWIMPSGRQQQYAASLGGIDWQDLYEHRDGYLLFEDLKEQWRDSLQPDYVLIDSRTGHTDTCGICTRQLPDAVTFLFFPNEQNLRGLAEVVRDIRAESEGTRSIETHFVMSNVPDLDDEDDILRGMLARFKADLGIDPEPQVVHRYDSLSLLNQVVFTQDRPKSRLAKEYRGVVDQVVEGNLEDKDGALHYLEQVEESLESPHDIDRNLSKIEQYHGENIEVLFRLSVLAGDEEDWERAKSLLDRAIEFGDDHPRTFLARARALVRMGASAAASSDAERVLLAQNLPFLVVREAIRFAKLDTLDVANLPAVSSLAPRARLLLASEMERNREMRGSIALLRQVLASDLDAATHDRAVAQLSLALIGIGELQEACGLLGSGGTRAEAMDVRRAFNYGMALWGHTGSVPQEMFERVVELDEAGREDGKDANYLQCMAVAYWATDRLDLAREFSYRAKDEINRSLRPTFSCWRYRTVPIQQFLEDTDGIIAMIGGHDDLTPPFMALSGSDVDEQTHEHNTR